MAFDGKGLATLYDFNTLYFQRFDNNIFIGYFQINFYIGGKTMINEEIKEWIQQNLIMQDEAREITNQSIPAFNQSVATGRIKPFVEFGEKRKTRLYLRSEIEEYARQILPLQTRLKRN